MSESVYERYKAALRRGHLAVLRGQLEAALEAYREAAAIVPERALPHASIGAVELRRGDPAAALAAFDAALERSPNDEAALGGRADALAALGRRAEAAESLDRLAGLLEADGRLVDACEVVTRALELAESRSRRHQMARLVDLVRASPLDAAAEVALARALRVLGEPVLPSAPAAEPSSGAPAPPRPTDAAAGHEVAGHEAVRPPDGEGLAAGSDVGEPGPVSGSPQGVGAGPEERRTGGLEPVLDDGRGADAGPDNGGVAAATTTRPAPMPADVVARITLAAEEALEAGDRSTAIERFLEAAAAHAAAGRTTAALDACARVVAAYPDALEAQEALVHLYLELGWRSLALEKVALLDRLTALGSDPLQRARVLLLAKELSGEAASESGRASRVGPDDGP